MKLKDILYKVAIEEIKGSTDPEIAALSFDSRQVQAGTLFIATVGTQSDGHAYITMAVEKGAKAIVCEHFPAQITEGVTYIRVADSSMALGYVAANFYGNPAAKVKLIGITGTNGKTTCATLLFKLFGALGYSCGLISTVQNQINERIIPSTHTTPDAINLNALLTEMVSAGCEYVFMEVSSHAIAQHRIAGIEFAGGVFTNISHDHLDFHKTFDEYIKVKKAFFDGLPSSAFALSNADDKRGTVMLQNTRAHKKTYSLRTLADFKGKVVENQFSGMLMQVDDLEVWFKLVGEFNAYNLLAVYATATLLEQDKNSVLTALSRLTGAEGRFECLVSKENVIAIVDYAHTPDAVQNVLETIQKIRQGTEQIITVIGCGGDRDAAKRPVMAQVAADWSTKVILTSDNPRSEDPQTILNQMQQGISPTNRKKTLSISDRREAIRTAYQLAQPGDIILVAGKGHEKYQEIKGVKHPFDDKEVLKELFDE